jgi:hypothetical protein
MLLQSANEICKICPRVDPVFRLSVIESVSLCKVERDQVIYHEGMTDASPLLFILKGRLRCYYTKDDKDILLEIGQENGFICYPPCWKGPGSVRIESITACKFLSLSMRKWKAIYEANPWEGDKMHNDFLQIDDYKCRKRIELLSMTSTEEKLICLYENFREYRYLPATLKAAFIGVSPHTVRRVLKEMGVEKK